MKLRPHLVVIPALLAMSLPEAKPADQDERLQKIAAEVQRRRLLREEAEAAGRKLIRDHESGVKPASEAQLAEARARIRAADERRAKGSPPPTAKGEASVRAQLVQADMATVAGLWRSMFGQEVTIAERVKSRIISMEIQATPREEIRSKFVAGLRERGIFVLEKADRVVFDLEPPPSPPR
jgi:hypothetical protein